MVDPSAEIALARLLAPGGWLSPLMPSFSLQRNPRAPGQYQSNPTTVDPSAFNPYPLPQLPSISHPLRRWPKLIQPDDCLQRPAFVYPSGPRMVAVIVDPSAEIPIAVFNGSPAPRSTKPWPEVHR